MQVAKILRQQCRALDVVGRLGGDEFLVILPMTKPSEAQVFVGRVQASLRDMEKANPEFGACTLEHGRRRVAAARHHGQQPARRGRHGALQGEARRAQHRRGRGQIAGHGRDSSSSWATPSGWISSTPRGAARRSTRSAPRSRRLRPLGRLQKPRRRRSASLFPARSSRSASSSPRWPRRSTAGASRRAASIARINEHAGAGRRLPAADPGGRRVAAPVRPDPPAPRAGGDRPLRRGDAWRTRGTAVRRCAGERCSLLFTDDSANRSRRWCDRGGVRPRRPDRAAPGALPMTGPDPVAAFERTRRRRSGRATGSSGSWPSNADRVLFEAHDEMLKRRVSVRINFYPRRATRAWFLREAEALGQLDHPAIGHVYDAGVMGDLAYRIGNWIDGEGLEDAVRRGPAAIPAVLSLARDLLGALDHAHLQGMIVRRIVPASVLVGASGRGTITDLRFSSYTLPAIPPGTTPTHADVHGARDPRRRGRRSGLRRLHRRRAALLRRHRPGAAARPAAAPPADRDPADLPAGHRAHRAPGAPARPGRPLPHRGGDAGGPRRPTPARSRPAPRPCARARSTASRISARWEKLAPPRPGRRLRAARAARARADSAGCTGCGISIWSARWRSRSCTRR